METAAIILLYALACAIVIGAVAFALFGGWIMRKFDDHDGRRARIRREIERGARQTGGRL